MNRGWFPDFGYKKALDFHEQLIRFWLKKLKRERTYYFKLKKENSVENSVKRACQESWKIIMIIV